jgi:hypothetical protein
MKHLICGKVIASVIAITVFSSMSILPVSAATDPVITWMESSLLPSTGYSELSIASFNGDSLSAQVSVSGACSLKNYLITTKKSGFCTVKFMLRAKGNFKARSAIKKFAIKPERGITVVLPTSFTNRTTANGLGSDIVNGVYVEGQNVYAATEGGLSISTDGGITFSNRTMANGLGSKNVNRVIANGSNVYAATEGGLSISSDGGNTFTNRTTTDGLGNNYVSSLAVVGSTVYAATNRGLSISTDGGVTFIYRAASDDMGYGFAHDIYVDGSKIYLSTLSGVSISSDGGRSFVNRKADSGLGRGMFPSTKGLFAFGQNLYAATQDGLSVSLDGGQTFRRQWIAANIGLGCDYINDVFVSGKTIYAATGLGIADCFDGLVGGLSMSTNGGRTYTNLTTANGLGNNMVNEVQVVGSKVYLATGLTGKGCVKSCGGVSISN